MEQGELSYIVVEGPIGVGKTTLARRLAESYGGDTLLEAPQENPFLERFYDNQRANALATQLFFLLQRVRQLDALHQADMFAPVRVADYMVDKDRLFARLTLDADEFALYDRISKQLLGGTPPPDLVIYLQAPVNVLLERIEGRGVAYEQDLSPHYLHRLVAAYTRFFYNFDAAPLVIVNAAEIDFAHNEDDYQLLFRQIQTIRRGRHYLNPLPF